jgi:membrane protein required for colicin V production
MTLFDYAVLSIVGVSVAVSVVRGLVREVLALAAWVVAFVVANVFSGSAAEWLPAGISNPSVRVLVAFAGIFVGVLIAVSWLALGVRKVVKSAGLGAEDRLLGGVFGFARGMLIVTILVILAGLTALPRQPDWSNAVLSPPLEALAVHVKQWLPKHLSEYINYD